MRLLGRCIGVELHDRAPDDPHQMVRIMVEDDENWFPKIDFSSYWLDEAILTLQAARDHLNRTCETDGGFGWKKK